MTKRSHPYRAPQAPDGNPGLSRSQHALRYALLILLPLFIFSLTACCNCPKPEITTPPPPPISLEDQIHRLNDHSSQIPLLKATVADNGLELTYPDDHGNPHTDRADGTLLIRTHFYAPTAPADVRLLGKVMDRSIIDAGNNAENWWFIVRVNEPSAWTGSMSAPRPYWRKEPVTPNSSSPGGGLGNILRTDLIPDLLAITPIMPSPGEAVMMRISDRPAQNALSIITVERDATAWIKREIIINRRTGDVDQVAIYNPAGLLVVSAALSDYHPSDLAEPGKGGGPRLPRTIRIDYPAEKASVKLTFRTLLILPPDALSDRVFATPSFEGLRIITPGP